MMYAVALLGIMFMLVLLAVALDVDNESIPDDVFRREKR